VIKKTRVLVVDDSLVIRRAIINLLTEDSEIEVVGQAVNGQVALAKIAELRPDVITLDVEMPVMDGLETLRHLKKSGSHLPVIMCSTLTERGAMATLDALSLGASCYVTKPHTSGSVEESIDALRRDLLPKVKALGSHFRTAHSSRSQTHAKPANPANPANERPQTPPAAAARPPASDNTSRPSAPPKPTASPKTAEARKHPEAAPVKTGIKPEAKTGAISRPIPTSAYVPPPRTGPPGRVDVVVIGVSTGGPNALATVLPALPKDLPVPILIVQHMPPVFTKLVAERLNNQCALSVREATEGELISAGKILIAPGDFHLTLEHKADKNYVRLTQTPPENFCRPAVDVLFRSTEAIYGSGMLGVVLTGMGSDGMLGCETIRKAGGQVIVQDAETSVVWGMPGSVADRGLAEAVLPIQQIAAEIVRRVSAQRKP